MIISLASRQPGIESDGPLHQSQTGLVRRIDSWQKILSILEEVLTEHRIALILVPPKIASSVTTDLLKVMTDRGISGILISVTRDFDALQNAFHQAEVDSRRVVVIDTLTGLQSQPESGNCFYASSPSNLNDISIILNKLLEKASTNNFVMVDSLATLLMYNDLEPTVRFLGSLTAKIRKSNSMGVFLTIAGEEHKFTSHIAVFCDKVLEVG